MLVRVWEKSNFYILLVEIQISLTSMQISVEVPKKINE